MPGVTVTLTGPVAPPADDGCHERNRLVSVPGLGVGTYNVRYELTGFKTVIKEGIRIQLAENALFNQALEISTVQETVTVSGETPLVDLKDTGETSRFTQEALQSIPSARDPWVIIEQAAGVAMDRQNVGGSASGQQSNFVARGAAMARAEVEPGRHGHHRHVRHGRLAGVLRLRRLRRDADLDGRRGRVDAVAWRRRQPGHQERHGQVQGIGPRSTSPTREFQSNNVTDEMRKQGVNTGNPIQNIMDYGFEVGGPIKRGRAWLWGSYGRQDINVGINNFYKTTPTCQAMKAAPLTYSLEDIRTCLSPTRRSSTTTTRSSRCSSPRTTGSSSSSTAPRRSATPVTRPTCGRSRRPTGSWASRATDLGSSWWKTGMPKTYKWSDRHIFSDRFMMESSYSHVGNNFALTFHEDDLRDVQPAFEIATSAYARSFLESGLRPADRQHRHHGQLLPPGLARRRPRPEVRLQVAQRHRPHRERRTAARPSPGSRASRR